MTYKIPLFDLNFDHQEQDAVLEVLRSRWISMGPITEQFEKKFADMLNVRYAVALSSCTAALHLAMKCLGISEGEQVICPSLTFVATVNAIRYVNASPVFCDVTSQEDLTIDPFKIELLVTHRTRAIVVMHYGGFPCDMENILRVARRYKLKIIEDACHGPLSEYKGQKLGTIGDIGCFSFFSNKNVSIGEGGMLVTNNKEYYERAKLLRSHGMTSLSYDRSRGHTTTYDVVDLGYNYRMDDIRAALGIVQLDKLQTEIQKRSIVRGIYLTKLSEEDNLIVPFKNNNSISSNYIFTVLLKNSSAGNRDYIRRTLHDSGIETSIHYPAVHRFSIYSFCTPSLPITEYVSDNIITLPMYGRLNEEQITYISGSLMSSLHG